MSDTDALTAAAVTNTVLAFMTFCPTPAEILELEPDTSLRVNEVSSVIVGVGLGVALSLLSKSGLPLLASLIASIAMVAGYEYLAQTTDARLRNATAERLKNVRI